MKEEIKRWWELAEKDLDAAQYNYYGKKYYVAVFLCEQAVEKVFKALWLKEKNSEIPKVHNLLFFLKELNIPEKFITTCEDLTGSYIGTRYPSDINLSFSKEDVEALLSSTKEIIKWVKMRI